MTDFEFLQAKNELREDETINAAITRAKSLVDAMTSNDVEVARYAREQFAAKFRCAACGAESSFERRNGIPYAETRRIPGTGGRLAVLCPNCSKEIVFGDRRDELIAKLAETE